MNISNDELIPIVAQFNPWWRGESMPDLPSWHRSVFAELFNWLHNPPAPRAVLLSGARQIGKTTLLLQAIEELLKKDVPPANILYVTFDHPIIKLAGIELVLQAWREREPKVAGSEYLLLDEAQFIRHWGTWIKHQVDFVKDRRIIFTGSAMPLLNADNESGVGRWHTIKLTTLSFYEYLQLKPLASFKFIINKDFEKLYKKFQFNKNDYEHENLQQNKLNETFIKNYEPSEKYAIHYDEFISKFSLPKLPILKSLEELFNWPKSEFHKVTELAAPYVGHFHEYLIRGGFPQSCMVESINQAQQLLREDIIDKVLKRDMTALFGVRKILELEQIFLYLCMHDGGLLDMQQLCQNLQVKRPTVQKYIDLLEATHLLYRLPPWGYGKDILRAKYKIYLADAAMSSAVLLKGKRILDDPDQLAVAVEAAVFKHLHSRFYRETVSFSYWQNSNQNKVDLIAEIKNNIIPFEVKYHSKPISSGDLKGLLNLCKTKKITRAYIITKSLKDFGEMPIKSLPSVRFMRVPAPLLCYWMGETELFSAQDIN